MCHGTLSRADQLMPPTSGHGYADSSLWTPPHARCAQRANQQCSVGTARVDRRVAVCYRIHVISACATAAVALFGTPARSGGRVCAVTHATLPGDAHLWGPERRPRVAGKGGQECSHRRGSFGALAPLGFAHDTRANDRAIPSTRHASRPLVASDPGGCLHGRQEGC